MMQINIDSGGGVFLINNNIRLIRKFEINGNWELEFIKSLLIYQITKPSTIYLLE